MPAEAAPHTAPILMREGEVAARYGIPVRTLRVWRSRGGPLPFTKLGSSVYYRAEDIEAAIAAGLRLSTSDPGRAKAQPSGRA